MDENGPPKFPWCQKVRSTDTNSLEARLLVGEIISAE